MITNKMMASATKLLQQSVKVYDPPEFDLPQDPRCGKYDLSHLNKTLKTHLLIVIDYQVNYKHSYLAYASRCLITGEGRSVAGLIMLNLA